MQALRHHKNITTIALPFMLVLTAFFSSSNENYNKLSIFLSYLLYFTFVWYVYVETKSKILATLLVSIKFLIIINPIFFNPLYKVVYLSIVIYTIGKSKIFYDEKFYKTIIIISTICLVVSLLQLLGIESFQKMGTGIEVKGISAIPVVFSGYSDVIGITTSQSRPNGITHANNLTSLFLTFFFVIVLNRTYSKKQGLLGLSLISFASAVNGGKIILITILVLNLFIIYINKANIESRKILFSSIVGYVLYFLIFPGVFTYNFHPDVFIGNISGRIMNIGAFLDLPLLINIGEFTIKSLPSDEFIRNESNNSIISAVSNTSEPYSNVSLMGYYIIPYIIFLIVVYFKFNRSDHNYNLEKFILISSIIYIIASPLITTIWFTFFLAFPIYQYIKIILNEHL